MVFVAAGSAYPAERAAALAGVPKSTVHYWARQEILVPSVSSERVKLWSYADLMALRTIDWLRRAKKTPEGREIPATSMRAIKRALGALRDLDLGLWSEAGGPAVLVDRAGKVVIEAREKVVRPVGDAGALQYVAAQVVDLTAPFTIGEHRGPDLLRPRPHLRIVPGKLAGAPHVEHTRVETEALAALASRDLPLDAIVELYPLVDRVAIEEAIDLEQQLRHNLAAAA
jgi:uncharacterized protein (DUF433 family)